MSRIDLAPAARRGSSSTPAVAALEARLVCSAGGDELAPDEIVNRPAPGHAAALATLG